MSSLNRPLRLIISFIAAIALALGVAPAAWAATGGTAQAVLYSTTDENLALGVAHLEETAEGLDIQVSFLGAPTGTHGFHIHAGDSCEDAGNAAGGHYNPDDVEHGYLIEDGFAAAHAGDLGNVVIGEDGTALYTALVPGLTLAAGEHPVTNHAFILHANPDDFSQPVGNAGSRVGCGLIVQD
ncbi:superoxide dismutase family protein [Pseudanabaena sp. FACHB-2040]|uniref:superoxide dismutase family protein n=1 Tax=Pseudanabaena sp. FACHB-2040 TaxID=2692859 RepID=UPI001683DCAC|nr:superoxide dismutase family protein [Pseudanabaena sp. FACHB-2040]MBD2257523.1 superoxide dismutase family protein [Pseudanabaena sp. FACHB-2040]